MKKSGIWLGILAGGMLAACTVAEAGGYGLEPELLATSEMVLHTLEDLEELTESESAPYISTPVDDERLSERLATYQYEPVTDTTTLAGVYGIAEPIADRPGKTKHSLLVIQPEGTFTH